MATTTSTPTTTTYMPGNQGWVLGPPGSSCQASCSRYEEATCNPNQQNAVNSNSSMYFVSGLLGVACNTASLDKSGNGFDPVFDSGSCWYSGEGSNCNAAFGSNERFCCCSTIEGACPAVAPPMPGNQGGVLSVSGVSCKSTCAQYPGAACNVANQNAVNSSAALQHVAALLGVTCSGVMSEDASVDSPYIEPSRGCWYPEGESSSCTANDEWDGCNTSAAARLLGVPILPLEWCRRLLLGQQVLR